MELFNSFASKAGRISRVQTIISLYIIYTKLLSIQRNIAPRIDAKAAKSAEFVEQEYAKFVEAGGVTNYEAARKYLFKVGIRYRAQKLKK